MLQSEKARDPEGSTQPYSTRTHPAAAYRDYLRCVAKRDVSGVLESMGGDYRERFAALTLDPDFWPLFDLWCESQRAEIHFTACHIKGDWAVLGIRESRLCFRVELRYFDGAWRVCAQTSLVKVNRGRASPLSMT